jgi:outer membrane biosynthesis protein TonB
MPTTPPQIDPEPVRPETEAEVQSGAETPEQSSAKTGAAIAEALSSTTHLVTPAAAAAAQAPLRIRTNRYGELEEHEIIHLIDAIEDERARARFRESIYISLFVWLAIAWVVFYGPRYLWHSPQLISPVEMMRQHEMVQLNAPVVRHAPSPAPRIDKGTLAKIKAMEPKAAPAPAPAPAAPVEKPEPTPPPVAAQPTPSNEKPALPLPSAPTPVPTRTAPPVVADAPRPQPTTQPSTKPSFSQPGTASDSMRDLANSVARSGPGSGGPIGMHGSARGASLGGGVEMLSPNPENVNFNPYIQRLLQQIYEQWMPLIPEEARPPLNKSGVTQIRFSIGPDGSVIAMHLDGSTHDDALNRAAWGSINGQQFAPLPKQFHGPLLELRIHYLVNRDHE